MEQKLKEWPDILFKNKEINLKHERVNKVKIELNRFWSKRKDIMIDFNEEFNLQIFSSLHVLCAVSLDEMFLTSFYDSVRTDG